MQNLKMITLIGVNHTTAKEEVEGILSFIPYYDLLLLEYDSYRKNRKLWQKLSFLSFLQYLLMRLNGIKKPPFEIWSNAGKKLNKDVRYIDRLPKELLKNGKVNLRAILKDIKNDMEILLRKRDMLMSEEIIKINIKNPNKSMLIVVGLAHLAGITEIITEFIPNIKIMYSKRGAKMLEQVNRIIDKNAKIT